MDIRQLIKKAIDARSKAVAPYSHFQVGAVAVTADNKIYTGCNIEVSSYGLTMCAERVAIFKALSDGEKKFKAIIIVADTETVCYPCGACR
ncbi:MAG: cytidine deaminase, partial [Ignavibacteria bacterium]|nr:cytidine deaminase [Ignavibacteria bacterium]